MNVRNYRLIIGFVSVIVPVAVAVIIFMPGKDESAGASWTGILPHLNGIINTVTALILITGYILIKNGKQELHKTAMLIAFTLGCIFLISYIIYHSTEPSTVFGDLDHDGVLSEDESRTAGLSRGIYLILLFSHIVLAAVVVPLVLFALYYALSGKFDRHRKIVRFAFPVWLYVSVSGVAVYLMISPYY